MSEILRNNVLPHPGREIVRAKFGPCSSNFPGISWTWTVSTSCESGSIRLSQFSPHLREDKTLKFLADNKVGPNNPQESTNAGEVSLFSKSSPQSEAQEKCLLEVGQYLGEKLWGLEREDTHLGQFASCLFVTCSHSRTARIGHFGWMSRFWMYILGSICGVLGTCKPAVVSSCNNWTILLPVQPLDVRTWANVRHSGAFATGSGKERAKNGVFRTFQKLQPAPSSENHRFGRFPQNR